MKTRISACTDRTFSKGLEPMALMVPSPVTPANDNIAPPAQGEWTGIKRFLQWEFRGVLSSGAAYLPKGYLIPPSAIAI